MKSALLAILAHAAAFAVAARGQNLPPRARIEVDSLEAFPGQEISFSAARSLDADAGPAPLHCGWKFGDGKGSTDVRTAHRYDAPGVYRVELSVSDGADVDFAQATVVVLAPALPERAPRSSPIALGAGGRELWVANPDQDSLTRIDLEGEGTPGDEIPVGTRPRTLALDETALAVHVACQGSDEIVTLDARTGVLRARRKVGRMPYGVVVRPGAAREVLVTCQGDGTLLVLSSSDLEVRARVKVGGTPRAISVTADGARAYVTNYISRGAAGTVYEWNLETHAVRIFALAEDPGPDTPSSGRGIPNLLSAAAIDPAGRTLWVGGAKSNVSRGPTRDARAFVPTNRVRGLVAPIELATGMDRIARRIDPVNADSAAAIEFDPRGRFAYVAHQGTGELSVYDLALAGAADTSDGSAVDFASRVEVGDAPQGLAASAEGSRLYVSLFLSRSVVELDVSDPRRPRIEGRWQVAKETLDPEVALGKRLFYRSRSPEHSQDGYVACASCHADGSGHDGQTWDLTQYGEGLRNTIDLAGRGGLSHGPVHWTANFDEIQDFEIDIVGAFGGAGFLGDAGPHPPLGPPNAGRSRELDALARYLATLTALPASPHREPDGSLSEAARRGKRLFYDPDVGCATCHTPPRFTDSAFAADAARSVLHDVGTIRPESGSRLGEPLPGFDTPTLRGVWATAPYLHDGSAPTLADVLSARNTEDRHGKTSARTPGEIADLVAFLLSIDDSLDALPDSDRRRDR